MVYLVCFQSYEPKYLIKRKNKKNHNITKVSD